MKGQYVSVPLNESITDGFPLRECRCGAQYCVGDIARKALRGTFERETIAFLDIDKNSVLKIDRHKVVEANAGRDIPPVGDTPEARAMMARLRRFYATTCVMNTTCE